MNKIVRTNKEVTELIAYLSDKDLIALDTETTGLDKEATIIGYSICCEENLAYYVITYYWDKDKQELVPLETVGTAPQVMQALAGKQIVGHNILFDVAQIKNNYGVDLIDHVFLDTMLAAHLTDENRRVGLKDLGAHYLGASAKNEQEVMKASIKANGGLLTKDKYELYKGDCNLIAEYGAQDAAMTFKLIDILVQELINENMVDFFFEETMPLLRGPTKDLNTVRLQVDLEALAKLKKSLELETLQLHASINKEIAPFVKDNYPGTSKTNVFNIGSGPQLAWLLFEKLGNTFTKLSDAGQELCRALDMKLPYTAKAKEEFIAVVTRRKGAVWKEKTSVDKKTGNPKVIQTKVRDYWNYLSTDKVALDHFANKYRWVAHLQEYKKAQHILTTYVKGIAEKTKYGTIQPNFKQHGTTSGRYSCASPNFQQLPREDKRVKACIVSRPGNVFVGADYSQLEPRCFASVSQDHSLMDCFSKGEDFYSVVGAPIFGVTNTSLFKDHPDSFAKKHPELRDRAKVIALATPYGRTARQQASAMSISVEESQSLIDQYFGAYPKVELMMLKFHEEAKSKGYVESMFGRKRRIIDALQIRPMYGNSSHSELPYEARNLLNLAVNHPIQSAGASITNRAMIAFKRKCRENEKASMFWQLVKIVLQIHDEIIVECPEELSKEVSVLLKDCMENTTKLPGVVLHCEPKIGKNLGELK